MINTFRYQHKITIEDKEVIVDLPNQHNLRTQGAIINDIITHPNTSQVKFKENNLTIPSKNIRALIDTGAGISCITPEVANELDLTPIFTDK
jgi:hypothetical protein